MPHGRLSQPFECSITRTDINGNTLYLTSSRNWNKRQTMSSADNSGVVLARQHGIHCCRLLAHRWQQARRCAKGQLLIVMTSPIQDDTCERSASLPSAGGFANGIGSGRTPSTRHRRPGISNCWRARSRADTDGSNCASLARVFPRPHLLSLRMGTTRQSQCIVNDGTRRHPFAFSESPVEC